MGNSGHCQFCGAELYCPETEESAKAQDDEHSMGACMPCQECGLPEGLCGCSMLGS